MKKIINKHPQPFDGLVCDLVKNKDNTEKEADSIESYELAREAWIKKGK